jgi:uncharacterized membrane protein YdjX (TVP38/TMEM64 family)
MPGTAVKRGKLMQKKTVIIRSMWFVVLAAVAVVLYQKVPFFREFVQNALAAADNPSEMKAFVLSYHAMGPFIILLLTMLQAVITIMPLFIVMMASTMVFGLFKGVVISLLSQLVAGYIAMRLTKYFGRPLVERFVPTHKLENLNKMIVKYDKWGVLLARLVPLGSFDLVNFAAGLLNVRDEDFIVGTLFGALPATLFYGIIGANLLNLGSIDASVILGLISLIIFFIAIAVWVRVKK